MLLRLRYIPRLPQRVERDDEEAVVSLSQHVRAALPWADVTHVSYIQNARVSTGSTACDVCDMLWKS